MSTFATWKTTNPHDDRNGAPDEAADEAWEEVLAEEAWADLRREAADEAKEDLRREKDEDEADVRQYDLGVK